MTIYLGRSVQLRFNVKWNNAQNANNIIKAEFMRHIRPVFNEHNFVDSAVDSLIVCKITEIQSHKAWLLTFLEKQIDTDHIQFHELKKSSFVRIITIGIALGLGLFQIKFTTNQAMKQLGKMPSTYLLRTAFLPQNFGDDLVSFLRLHRSVHKQTNIFQI